MCLDVGSLLPKPKADSVSSITACIMLTPPGGHAATQHQKARVLNITFAWNDLLYFICSCIQLRHVSGGLLLNWVRSELFRVLFCI